MKREARPIMFNLRMSEEMGRLAKLSEHYGITASDVVRMLIKRDVALVGMGFPPNLKLSKS